MALKSIKFWAKRSCSYGNSYGYCGGAASTISVRRICRLFPNATSHTISSKFFEIYSSWKLPSPVLLKTVIDSSYSMNVWDPKIYPANKCHKMPVIVRVCPSISSTHNITNKIQCLIMVELAHGNELLTKGKDSATENLRKLCILSGFQKSISHIYKSML